MTKPRYGILNETDAPHHRMVVQHVPGRGYCYMDRTKARFDGMSGSEVTDVREFGVAVNENKDGATTFYLNTLPVTAKYRDGVPRRWQDDNRVGGLVTFEWKTLRLEDVPRTKRKKSQ